MSARTGKDTALAVTLFIGAALVCVYWTVWYLVPGGEAMLSFMPGDPAHVRFENAFLLSDLWMALAAVMAGARLLSDPPRAIGWLYMAGSASLFLAGMDILYCIQNGVYGTIGDPARTSAVITEMLVNVGCLALAALAIGRASQALRNVRVP